tara:strand:+ start:231 stop:425 length:195 start_codon:yes stop_codon:yes gene_type:complete
MEKILLNSDLDLINAINKFGVEWEKEIKNEISEYPCVLVSFYANDIEFGEMYSFSAVSKKDLNL